MVLCLVTLTDLQTRRAGNLSASAELVTHASGVCYSNMAGWLAGCLSHAGIVSKWLNLS